MQPHLSHITCDSKRFCAVLLTSNNLHTLIVYVYLPTNNGTVVSDNLYLEVLEELKALVDSVSHGSLLFVGDFRFCCIFMASLIAADLQQ